MEGVQPRVVVLGYLVRGPLGGMAWHSLQYALGFARLGCDVMFVEIGDGPLPYYDPSQFQMTTSPSFGLTWARTAFECVGLSERWALFDADSSSWAGPASRDVVAFCRSADVVVNVSGANRLEDWLDGGATKVFVDTDPGFQQARIVEDAAWRSHVEDHDVHFTFGELICTASCRIPPCGIAWLPTRQPVVLDEWAVTRPPDDAAFTTVMQWESYLTRSLDGVVLGMKDESMRPVIDLPRHTSVPLEIALGGAGAPRSELESFGWRLRDPGDVSRTLDTYRKYIQSSRGEFAVAKQGYAMTRSGWFSERSANYLASGRPVVVEETGFSDVFESGTGVVPFASVTEAVEALDDVTARYPLHARAARELAEAHFDARIVLSALLDRCNP